MSDNFSRPQHTAPLTPTLQLANGSPIVLVALFAVGLSWWLLPMVVGFLVVGGLGYWASWRKQFFWINEKGELEVRSGIFLEGPDSCESPGSSPLTTCGRLLPDCWGIPVSKWRLPAAETRA